ncbi:MAG: indole-3-glycerol-phosphate synthase [Phycisphaerales bacterium]|nr:MAG: indole-3-glycerol-phosphate synthase [Phycisphaerales bacterium]
MPGRLAEIVAHTRTVIEASRARTPESELVARSAEAEPARAFASAVRDSRELTGVIAEIKRRSPSAGVIRAQGSRWSGDHPLDRGLGFEPEGIAERYLVGGASAISCLTDEKFFGGDLSYIARIKASCPLPVLRKDFILEAYQVYEARALGADAVLLIAECLLEADGSASRIADLLALAESLGMSTLLEIHDRACLDSVAHLVGPEAPGLRLFGVNNRDLRTMRTDLGHVLGLLPSIPDRTRLVAESGITTREDLDRLRESDVRMALVGEHLMRQADPGAALAALLHRVPPESPEGGQVGV